MRQCYAAPRAGTTLLVREETFSHASAGWFGRCCARRTAYLWGAGASPERTLDEAVKQGRHPGAGSEQPACRYSPAAARSLADFRGHSRRLELLGFLVYSLPRRGADPGASPSTSLPRRGGTVLGVTFRDSSTDSLCFVKHTGSLSELARHYGRIRAGLRHHPDPRDLRDRLAMGCCGDLARRNRRTVLESGDRLGGEQYEIFRACPPLDSVAEPSPTSARPTACPSAAALCSWRHFGSAVIGSNAVAATPRTSMPAIERQVMCVTCKIPLNVAESPQSQRERAYIRGLIAEGKTESQIKRELVGQYGSSVLALPAPKASTFRLSRACRRGARADRAGHAIAAELAPPCTRTDRCQCRLA